MLQQGTVWALHQLHEDCDVLSLSGVGAVHVGGQFVEIKFDFRAQFWSSLEFEASVQSLLEGLEALRDVLVDEEESGEPGVILYAQVRTRTDQQFDTTRLFACRAENLEIGLLYHFGHLWQRYVEECYPRRSGHQDQL